MKESTTKIFDGHETSMPDEPDIAWFIMMSIKTFQQTVKYIADLKTCIMVNRTIVAFVTSDDPVFYTNKLAIEKDHGRFGYASAGFLTFMPISSRYALMCYDGGVYTVPDRQGFLLDIRKDDDVLAVNEMQYLNSDDNVYFEKWDDRERILIEFQGVACHRSVEQSKTTIFVPVGDESEERYRIASDEERRSAKHTRAMTSLRQLRPSIWLSRLKFRSSMRMYSNGSAAGFMRNPEWFERRL